jgi:hypothetical protein
MSEGEYVRDEHQRGRPSTRRGKKEIYSFVSEETFENLKVEAEARGLSLTRTIEEIIIQHFVPLSIIDLVNLPPEIRKAVEELAKQNGGYCRLIENALIRYAQKTEKKNNGKGRKSNYDTFKKIVLILVELEECDRNKKVWKSESELMRVLRQCGSLDRRTLKNYLEKMADEGLAKQNFANWMFRTSYDQKRQTKRDDVVGNVGEAVKL